MRLTAFLLLTCSLHLSAGIRSQTVSFSGRDVTLKKAFDEIEKQTGFYVLSKKEWLKNYVPFAVEARQMLLVDFLDLILTGQRLDYTIRDKNILITYKPEQTSRHPLTPPTIAPHPPIHILGRVVNEKGEPVIASVIVKGTNNGVTTNANGEFELMAPDDAVLLISGVSIESREYKYSGNPGQWITIKTLMKVSSEDEVVINAGYYNVKDRQRTGSISRITSKEIEKQPVTNMLATMQGRMAGVNITQETGVPGGAFKIEIRGTNSIRTEGNQPLYIIDGMAFSADPVLDRGGGIYGNGGVSPLNGINPADIESLTILKDADATSIYGSRGANGVVLITTKKGKAGKTAFFMNASSGVSQLSRYVKMMNTSQYLEMRNEGFQNDNLTPGPADYDVNGTWDQNRSVNWQKELVGRAAPMYMIQAGLSGGNKNTQFLISSSFALQKTVFPGNYSDKKSGVHFNISHRSDDNKLHVELSGNYVLNKNNLPARDITNESLLLAPNAPALLKENGELNWENGLDNPLSYMNGTYGTNTNTLTASSTLSYKILQQLELKTILGFSDNQLSEKSVEPNTIYNPAYGMTSEYSSLFIGSVKEQAWRIEPQLSWQQNISRGVLNIMAGTTFEKRQSNSVRNGGQGFASNALIESLDAAAYKFASVNNSEYNYNALFGRVNYNWQEKYIVNLTGRRDGSSRFGPGKRFGNFGAVGAAWIISGESFMNRLKPVVSFAKIRASYGTAGSDQIGNYQYLNTYTSSAEMYQGINTMYPSQLFNPDFSWETNKKMDAAFDLGFLNDRLMFSVNYYRNRSSNQLVGIPLAGTTGFTSIQSNLPATVQNKGWEFELKTVNVKSRAFNWSTSVNITFARNKLVAFPGLAGSTYAESYVVGHPLNIIRAYHYLGIDPSTGTYQVEDVNGDGVISYTDDRQVLIDASPRFYGGMNNHLTFKNIELDFQFQFVKQNSYATQIGRVVAPGLWINQPVNVLDRWQKAGDESKVQAYTATYGDRYIAFSNAISSDISIGDASFMRLKNVSLSYTLPASLLKKGTCLVFMQAQNLLTFTKYKDIDPETITTGRGLPPLRVITGGIKLNF